MFTDSQRPSGSGEHMLVLAAELRDRYDVSFVCPSSPTGLVFLERARALGMETFGIEVDGEPGGRERLRDWLCERRVSIFHGHAGVAWEGHDGVYAAHEAGVPAIVRTEHLPDLTDTPWLVTTPWQPVDYEAMAELIERLICVSEAVYESFLHKGVPKQKLRLVRNGIHPRPASSSRAAVRSALGVPPEAQVVLTVGRLVGRKGYRSLLEAVPAVVEREPDALFLWVGEGPLEGELRGRVRAAGLEGKVRLLGRREDVPDLMAASDLFVLPSLAEGLPLVVLEAMAAGLPVVGTRVCGTSEAVRDGVTGRLVEADDASALAAAVLEPLEDPRLLARWSEAGRSFFESEFDAGRMARETAEVYDELLSRNAPSRTGVWVPG
jgi:glycosyltransferase involved in cell wall biosynthesis